MINFGVYSIECSLQLSKLSERFGSASISKSVPESALPDQFLLISNGTARFAYAR